MPFLRGVFRGSKILTSRDSVKGIWYESNRAGDDKMPTSLGARLINGLLLILTLSLVTGPLWNFIPWSQTPLTGAFGKFRFVNAMFLCHVGLLLWPVAIFLFSNLLRQTWSREWIRLAALTAFCSWQAWQCSQGVVRLWLVLFGWAVI